MNPDGTFREQGVLDSHVGVRERKGGRHGRTHVAVAELRRIDGPVRGKEGHHPPAFGLEREDPDTDAGEVVLPRCELLQSRFGAGGTKERSNLFDLWRPHMRSVASETDHAARALSS